MSAPSQNHFSSQRSASSSSSSSSSSNLDLDDKATMIAKIQKIFPKGTIEEHPNGSITVNPNFPNSRKGKKLSLTQLGQSLSTTPYILGNKAVMTPNSETNLFQSSGLFNVPQSLIIRIQKLSKKYESMSLTGLIVFGAMQAINAHTPLTAEQRCPEHFLYYGQMCRLIEHCYNATLYIDDLKSLDNIIAYFQSLHDEEFTLLFVEIKNYFLTLLGEQSYLKLSEEQMNAWSLPIRNYKLTFLTTQVDRRKVVDVRSEMRLHACLLPSMINDFGKMLKWIFEPALYEHCKTQYQEFMAQFREKITHHVFPKDSLSSFINNADPNDPIIEELSIYFKEHPDQPLDLASSNISKELFDQLNKLMIDEPLPLFDPDIIFDWFEPQIQEINALESIFAVDILPYAKMFSETRNRRLFQQELEYDILELIQNRNEEYEKLFTGIDHLEDQALKAKRMCDNYVFMMISFPLWLYTHGAPFYPAQYQIEFTKNRNAIIDFEGSEGYNRSIHEQLAWFKEEHPELMPLLHPLCVSCEQLSYHVRSLFAHIQAVKIQARILQSICTKLEVTTKAENAKKKAAEELLQAESQRRLLLQQQLIEEEEKTKKVSNQRKSKKSSKGRRSAKTHHPAHLKQMPRHQKNLATPPAITKPPQSPASPSQVHTITKTEDIGPIGTMLNSVLEGFTIKKLDNPLAQQSWESALQVYRDLIAELADRPLLSDHRQVSEHSNRLVVHMSSLMEQMISAHFLEEKNPKNHYERWDLLRKGHDIELLFTQSGLTEIPGLPSLIQDLNYLEIWARSLYTSPNRESRGADLLYQIEQLRLSPTKELSDVVLQGTSSLLKETFSALKHLIPGLDAVSIDSLDTLTSSSGMPKASKSSDPLLIAIDAALSTLPQIEAFPLDPVFTNPMLHLYDSRRILELLRIRIERGLDGGNIRNYYKTLTTYVPLATENLCIAKTALRGTLDLTAQPRSTLTHNLMDWCEQLQFFNPEPQIKAYLYGSDRVHNDVRYSPLYTNKHQGNIARITLQQLAFLNRYISAPTGKRGEGWTLVGTAYSTLHHTLTSAEKRAQAGLKLFTTLSKLAIQ